ncbi:acyltransferase family protein [Serratia ureilytica]|uniref:acyltransferase family protein n=1 Tax=Serratia ureilytica TaxID=300181 RepID=UPI001D18BD74|nr:acyltransferase [Serratia ureilytica]MCC4104633.1 acyltransferase [Serratia ureilytica]
MLERNDIIDFFRGVAVMLVTAFHLFLWSGSLGRPLPFGFDVMGSLGNGWIGVGMFFVISGYCMAGSSGKAFSGGFSANKYGIYFLKRYLRIAIPFYISIAFWLVLIRGFGIAIKPTGFSDIISHVLFIHNFSEKTFFSISGVYWSLAVEMQFYLLLPIFVVLFTTLAGRLCLLIAVFVISILVNFYSENQLLTWGIPSYLSLFVLGWLCAIYQNEIGSFIRKANIHWVLVAIFVLLLFYKGHGFNNKVKLYEVLISSVFALLMVSLINRFSGKSVSRVVRSVAFIGKCSFSIYLYNYIFWALDRTDLTPIKLFMAFSFVIGFGILMYLAVERESEKLRRKAIRTAEAKFALR